MTSSTRFWNRLVLALAGTALLIIGGIVLTIGVFPSPDAPRPEWAVDSAGAAARAWDAISQWTIVVGGVGPVLVALVIAVAVALVLIGLLGAFVLTRGRGRIADIVSVDDDGGRTVVDRNIADAILSDPLVRRSDVVSAHVVAYMVRRTRAIELAVRVQPNAALDAVIAATERAVGDWDRISGTKVPVVIRISGRSWRDAFRPKTRVR